MIVGGKDVGDRPLILAPMEEVTKTLGMCLPPFPILYKLPQHTEASVQPQKSKTPTCMQS